MIPTLVALLLLIPFAGSEVVSGAWGASLRASWETQPWRWPWGSLAVALAQAAAWVMAMQGAGRPWLAMVRVRFRGRTLRFAFAHLLGFTGVGLALMGIGLVGLDRRPPLLAVHALFVVLGAGGLVIRARNLPGWPGRGRWTAPWPYRIAAAAAGIWTLWFLAGDLASPESFFDVMVYHLALPARWLAEGREGGGPPFFAYFPHLASEHFLTGLAVSGEVVARMQVLVAGCLLSVAVHGLARRWLAPGPSLVAAALAGGHPMVASYAAHAMADVPAALATVLALAAAVHAAPTWPRGPSRPGWLVLAGVGAGAAAGCKPTGLVVPSLLVLLALPCGIRGALFLGTAAVVAWSPFGAKAWLFTGDPVFPVFAHALHSPSWSAYGQRAYAGELLGVWNQLAPSDFLAWGDRTASVSAFKIGLIGPVAGLSAWFLLHLRERRAAQALCFTAALACLTAFTVPASRFFAAGFVLLPALLLAAVPPATARWLGVVLLLLQAGWFPAKISWVDRPWEAATGRQSREAFYETRQEHGPLEATDFLGRFVAGRRRRLLASGDAFGWLLPPASRAPSFFDDDVLVHAAREAGSADALFRSLRQLGIGYLYVNVPVLVWQRRWEGRGWEGSPPYPVLAEFFRRHATLLFARGTGWVYGIGRAEEGADPPECYRPDEGRSPTTSDVCLTRSQGDLVDGRTADAVRFGWAAVSANEGSGMAWAALGDALFVSRQWDQCAGVYARALHAGWKTSAVYRNQALGLARSHNLAGAQQAMEYARRLDPFAAQLRFDQIAIFEAWRAASRPR